MSYKYLFGPVPSRRLGISLGVDLVPFKVCSFNCIYCEVGKTTNLTVKRNSYINLKELIKELDDFLVKKPKLDYITFSGNGEPILNSDLGKITDYLKKNYSQYKIALITNGSLFFDKKLIKEIEKIDLLLPSLDAVSKDIFKKINRPHPSLDIIKIINGLIQLREIYKGKIYLEVFIIPGLNDSSEELSLLKEIIIRINPDLIQLNTQDRPAVEDWVIPASISKLKQIAEYLKPLSVEIISNYESRENIPSFNKNINEQILETIKRRPCTIEDLVELLNINMKEINKYLNNLLAQRIIKTKKQKRGIFFTYISNFSFL